jgi:phosphatidylinositol-3-phosphatase
VHARTALLALAAALAISACGSKSPRSPETRSTQAAATVRPCGRPGSPPSRYAHVIWIVMENESYADVLGSSDAPYLRGLAKACGSATHFTAEAHPSLPNYVAMTSGSTQGVTDDDGPSSHKLAVPSIFSQLGTRWRALQEAIPAPCGQGNSGRYAVRHNPAAYYTNIRASCRRRDVRLTARPNLSAAFTFVTPDLCHDMHDCSVATGDRWLAGFVPRVLHSRQYAAGGTALFITWDEDDYSSGNVIPTLVIAPHTAPGTRSAGPFTHYSLLRTTEELLGLPTTLGAAAQASSMRAAFGL